MSEWVKIFYAASIAVLAVVGNIFETTTPILADPVPDTAMLVRLTPADAGQFQRTLSSLADQGHVAFVAEGAPLKPVLASNKVSELTSQMPLDQVVSRLAGFYDYNEQRHGNVFILTKRYTDSHDLPCVTLEECRLAAKNLAAILDAFSPNFATSVYISGPSGERDAVVKFFQSLSPAQLQAAQSKTLHYGSLSPGQQTLIQSFFLYQYVQMPLDKVNGVIDNLDCAPQSALKVRNEDGCSGLFMVVPNLTSGAPPALFPLIGGLTPLDRPQPSLVRVSPPSIATPLPAESTTLGMIVAGLRPINGKPPLVDASLADKPVTAAGLDNATSMDVLNALSILYRLDLETRIFQRTRLQAYCVTPPASLSELDAAVWAALPISYARALHIVSADVPAPGTASAPTTASDNFQEQIRFLQLPAQLQQEANERLLLAVQPQLKKQGLSMRVTVSSLDSEAKTALAISLMAELMTTLHDGFSGMPHQSVLDCIGNMDQTLIYTVQGEDAHLNNQDIPSLYLEGTDPYTGRQVGLGGVRFFGNG